jgi:hypothetical protein
MPRIDRTPIPDEVFREVAERIVASEQPADPTPPRAGDLAESWTRYARELAKAHGVWDEAVTEGRTAAAAQIAREIEEELVSPLVCAWTKREAIAIARSHAEGTETDG